MKKIICFVLAVFMAVGLTACSGGAASENSNTETIKITALNGNKEETEIEVPYDPQRIAILDLAALDILDNLGLGDRVVGTATTSMDYLQSYVTDEKIANLGTIKEADMEAVMKSEPDIIFIGGRLSASYDALNEIAPVVYLSTDTELGLVQSVNKNASIIASIFGKEDEVAEKMSGFDARIAKLKEVSKDKTAIMGMSTSGSFNVLGNDGRCSIICNEIGFTNIGLDIVASNSEKGGSGGQSGNGGKESQSAGTTATHGNESSFELITSLNPDYLFVMDRDAAIGTEGAQLAREIVENELVKNTDAYKNGNIVYLEHPAVWYTAEGGITALDIMLQDLETSLIK